MEEFSLVGTPSLKPSYADVKVCDLRLGWYNERLTTNGGPEGGQNRPLTTSYDKNIYLSYEEEEHELFDQLTTKCRLVYLFSL